MLMACASWPESCEVYVFARAEARGPGFTGRATGTLVGP